MSELNQKVGRVITELSVDLDHCKKKNKMLITIENRTVAANSQKRLINGIGAYICQVRRSICVTNYVNTGGSVATTGTSVFMLPVVLFG